MDDKQKTGLLIKDLLKSKKLKQKDVAEFLGIKPPSLSQMLNGRIPFPLDKFLKIISLVSPGSKTLEELKKLYFGSMAGVLSGGSSQMAELEREREDGMQVAIRLGCVPVMSFEQAAGYEPALEPIGDYARECSDELAMFAHEIHPGYFALNVRGDDLSPDFPDGTMILVAGGEFSQRGDVVAAKLRDGRVVVKRYYRRGDTIMLDSVNDSGKGLEWRSSENPGYIQWMYPVLEATIDLRNGRREGRNSQHINYDPSEFDQQYAVAESKDKYCQPGKK